MKFFKRSGRCERPERYALLLVVLAVFAVYAPAIRLMPMNDDATQVIQLIGVTPFSIFENRYDPYSLIFGHYRPVGYLPWIFIQVLFGWYLPSMLHALNVFVHVISTALVGAMALRLARMFHLRGTLMAVVSAALFGLWPLAFQAVLWSAAEVHPQVAMFGLATTLAYLRLPDGGRERRTGLLVVGVLLALTCLSHEQGPVYGAFLLWAEAAKMAAKRTEDGGLETAKTVFRPPSSVFFFACAAAYFVFYRVFLKTAWTSSNSLLLEGGLAEWPVKIAYHLQNLMIWPSAIFRPLFNVGETDGWSIVFGIFVLGMTLAIAILIKTRKVLAGAVILAVWALGTLPSLMLSQRYLLDGPRLLYPATIGAALFWGLLTSALAFPSRREGLGVGKIVRILLAVGCGLWLAWSTQFIAARLNENARLTPPMQMLDADLKRSQPDDRLLFINTPFVNLTTKPAFFLGREGLPTWMYYYATDDMAAWWPQSLSGIHRATSTVMHEASLTDRETEFRTPDFLFTKGGLFRYGVFGRQVDNAGLREAMLKANFIYRFEYDAPGFRMTRLAEIHPAKQPAPPALAAFSLGAAQARLISAQAARCGGQVQLNLAWDGFSGGGEPAAIFVHLVDGAGKEVGAADKDLLDGALAVNAAPSNTQISETRLLAGPADATQIKLGLYARSNGQRFKAMRDGGGLWEGEEVVVPIGLCAQ
ncbi:MAG TPA: hypothetical protein PLW39_02980 [Thermoflexales bacterium]|nr:hypothetical protein [Thermoflexales bacterium]HQZ21213.1 hypothetical protein [Thermoflexales bacterium]